MRPQAWPDRLNLRITDRCDLSCEMCGQARRRGAGHTIRRELEPEDVARYLAPVLPGARFSRSATAPLDPRTSGPTPGGFQGALREIYVWGGEPLLHPRLGEMLRLLSRTGAWISLNTSGSRLWSRLDDLSVVDELIVSLDGPAPVHDRVRGAPGLFERARTGAEAWRRRRSRQEGRAPILTANLVVTAANHAHLEALRPSLARFDRIVIQLPTFTTLESGRAYARALWDRLGIETAGPAWRSFLRREPPMDAAVLARGIECLLAAGRTTMIPYRARTPAALIRYFDDPRDEITRKRGTCLALARELSVEPDGRVVACPDFPDVTLGVITECQWPDPWGAEALDAMRAAFEERSLGVCERCCRFF